LDDGSIASGLLKRFGYLGCGISTGQINHMRTICFPEERPLGTIDPRLIKRTGLYLDRQMNGSKR
jgi:hypothetical protein